MAMTPDDITRLADRVAEVFGCNRADAEALRDIEDELRQLAQQGKAGGVPKPSACVIAHSKSGNGRGTVLFAKGQAAPMVGEFLYATPPAPQPKDATP